MIYRAKEMHGTETLTSVEGPEYSLDGAGGGRALWSVGMELWRILRVVESRRSETLAPSFASSSAGPDTETGLKDTDTPAETEVVGIDELLDWSKHKPHATCLQHLGLQVHQQDGVGQVG